MTMTQPLSALVGVNDPDMSPPRPVCLCPIIRLPGGDEQGAGRSSAPALKTWKLAQYDSRPPQHRPTFNFQPSTFNLFSGSPPRERAFHHAYEAVRRADISCDFIHNRSFVVQDDCSW